MARLRWDGIGERFFEAGVDRGVLYLTDGSGVAWNGLTSVEEIVDATSEPFYFDGIKYMDLRNPGDFSASLRAITYPDEFLAYEGVVEFSQGMFASNQPVDTFSLSYRTRVGNDVDGTDHAYKIHIVYNITATPENKSYPTMSSEIEPSEFGWTLHTVPVLIEGARPSAHVVLDTRKMDRLKIEAMEDILYGDDVNPPRLPTISELIGWRLITITDHGDGTWSAEGPDELIKMLEPTLFQIQDANATFIDAFTYEISTTE